MLLVKTLVPCELNGSMDGWVDGWMVRGMVDGQSKVNKMTVTHLITQSLIRASKNSQTTLVHPCKMAFNRPNNPFVEFLFCFVFSYFIQFN